MNGKHAVTHGRHAASMAKKASFMTANPKHFERISKQMNATGTRYDDALVQAKSRLGQIRNLQAEGLICLDGDFVPSVHYPPITQYSPMTGDALFSGYTLPRDGLMDVYAHLPFCEQRCTFCHYPGKLGQQEEEKDRYLVALEKEMDLSLNRLGLKKFKARSILLGGGTPTFLTPRQLDRFLDFFVERVDLSSCKQFNVDTDPGSLVGASGQERLRIMKDHGIDRLTIGVQSLNESVLKIMNRPHGVRTAEESIYNSKEHGFQLNIEFIFGHPGQTLENWIEVMERAVLLPVEEIQLYRLKVLAYGDLQGHILKIRQQSPSGIPSFDVMMTMKLIGIEILRRNGFHENLRRVYSKEKKHFSHYAHNQCCMLFDQIGFGLTAFSSLRDRFALNTQSFQDYYDSIEKGQLPINRGCIRTPEQQLRWALILPLKNRNVRKSYFEKIAGIPLDNVFVKKMERLKQHGLLEEIGGMIQLTELGGLVADEVVEQFNSNEFMPFPEEAYASGALNPFLDNTIEDAFGTRESEILPNPSMNRKAEPLHDALNENGWNVKALDDSQISSLLDAVGDLQQELFARAREVRRQVHGDSVHLRGVIEYSNICRKNCDYCAMRCGNPALERYQMNAETILSLAESILEAGIGTVFLQAGENPASDGFLEEIIPVLRNRLGADVLLCIGERSSEAYQRFASLGCKSFILKFETSNAASYMKIAHTPLEARLQCIRWIREAGMRVGTGNILGLPGQTRKDILSDLRYSFELNPDFISIAPFIPNPGTPFQANLPGDIQQSLNLMAILRLGLPDALIPSVSALEVVSPKGQLMGLNAGANVMTINFTPKTFQDNYRIYSKDRFIVKLNYVEDTVKAAGLKIRAR